MVFEVGVVGPLVDWYCLGLGGVGVGKLLV